VPEPADPSVAVSRPLRDGSDDPEAAEVLVGSLFVSDNPPPHDHGAVDVDDFISAPPAPAFAGAGAPAHVGSHSPIDWTGQGGRVDERVRSSDDILRASEATALPVADTTGGSELARLLAKVEARLRDYD
jgi:hypothetical protein